MYTLKPIGHVESPVRTREEAPKQGEEGSPEATLVFDTEYRVGFRSVAVGDLLIVLTWLDRSDRSVLEVHPRGDRTLPLHGVFSTRSPDRPNPIGLHRVVVLGIEDGYRMRVANMEALHMTPILDVKPVLGGIPEA